jgi:hypothetical protein
MQQTFFLKTATKINIFYWCFNIYLNIAHSSVTTMVYATQDCHIASDISFTKGYFFQLHFAMFFMLEKISTNCMFTLWLQFRQLVNTLYISGYSISFVALFLSLLIFTCFKWVDAVSKKQFSDRFCFSATAEFVVFAEHSSAPASPSTSSSSCRSLSTTSCGLFGTTLWWATHPPSSRTAWVYRAEIKWVFREKRRDWLLQLQETLLIKTYVYISPSHPSLFFLVSGWQD